MAFVVNIPLFSQINLLGGPLPVIQHNKNRESQSQKQGHHKKDARKPQALIAKTAPQGAADVADGKEYLVKGQVLPGVFTGSAGMEDAVVVAAGIYKSVKENNGKIKIQAAPCQRKGQGAEDKAALYQNEPAPVEMPAGKAGKDGKPDKPGYAAGKKHQTRGAFGVTQAVSDVEGDNIDQDPDEQIGTDGPYPSPVTVEIHKFLPLGFGLEPRPWGSRNGGVRGGI
jgi:hypothetical protein